MDGSNEVGLVDDSEYNSPSIPLTEDSLQSINFIYPIKLIDENTFFDTCVVHGIFYDFRL